MKVKLTTSSPKYRKVGAVSAGSRLLSSNGSLARARSLRRIRTRIRGQTERHPSNDHILGRKASPPLSLTCLKSACRTSVSRSRPQAAKRGRGTRQPHMGKFVNAVLSLLSLQAILRRDGRLQLSSSLIFRIRTAPSADGGKVGRPGRRAAA